MNMDFNLGNELKELGTCKEFTEMNEDMWVCLGEYGKEIQDEYNEDWYVDFDYKY